MPIQDRVAAAKQIDTLLRQILSLGGFKLKYRITAQPPANADDLEQPELLIEFAGPDSSALVERNGELLRSMEHLAIKLLRLEHDEHDRISFDCHDFKKSRNTELRVRCIRQLREAMQNHVEELREITIAEVGAPRMLTAAAQLEGPVDDLSFAADTAESYQWNGEGMNRCVVVYPADYTGAPYNPPARSDSRFGGRGRSDGRGGDRRGGGGFRGGNRGRGDDRRGGGGNRGRGRRY